jgi:glycosyltransferase involved in cell wall biosynthesis
MKILCLEQFSSLGGGQLSLLDLLPGLRARGWDAVVAIPGEGALSDRVRKLGFEVKTLRAASYANGRKTLMDVTRYACKSPELICTIAQMLSSERIDLLYVNAPRLLPMAAIAARIRTVPLVFHCHSRIVQGSGVLAIGESLRFSRARVIACCKYAAEPIRPYVKPGCLSVLYGGVPPRVAHASDRDMKLRNIGVIGRVEPEKGQIDFVYAARSVLDDFPECRFSIIGAPSFSSTTYLDRVVEASRGLPIEFLGWQDDISHVLAQLDLIVVPSAPVDSAPRVIFEAFAAGVPVIAFPSGGIPEIINDGENGFLAADMTVQALAERIRSILKMDSASLQAVVDRARKGWQQEYTLEIYQQRVQKLLSHAVTQ